jgi:hypothetical protein
LAFDPLNVNPINAAYFVLLNPVHALWFAATGAAMKLTGLRWLQPHVYDAEVPLSVEFLLGSATAQGR